MSSASECSCAGAGSCAGAVVAACGAQRIADSCLFSRRSSLSTLPSASIDAFFAEPKKDPTVTELEPFELPESLICEGVPLILDREAERNAKSAKTPSWEEAVSVFFSVSKPQIATRMYLRRLFKYAYCSEAAFVVVLIYLQRLEAADAKLKITAYNMHRLLITALMLAAKMLDDRCFSNAHYAKVGGIASVKEMNRLEVQMLTLLNYRLNVTPEEFQDYVGRLRKAIAPTSPTAISCVTSLSPFSSSSQLPQVSPAPVSYMTTTRTYSNLHNQHYGVSQQYVEQGRGYEHPHQYVHYHHAQMIYSTPSYGNYAYRGSRICSTET